MSDSVDWDQIAQEVKDASEPEAFDPIMPEAEMGAEEKLLSDPEHEVKRNIIADALFTGRGRKEPKEAKPPKQRKPLPPKRKGSLTKRLTELYVGFGMALMPFDQVCATAIINSAERCAESLDNLAYENDAVRRIVLAMLETNAWGMVILAHAPIMAMVLTHHVPAFRDGIAAKFAAVQMNAEAERAANEGAA